jgi:hypothetical protein
MHGTWKVGSFPDEVWLTRAFGADLPSGAIPIAPENAAFHAGEWLHCDGLGRQILAEIDAALGRPVLARPALAFAPLHARVREALRDGSLQAFRLDVKLSGGAVHVVPEPPKPVDPTPEQKTWVGIELMDDSDPPQPVPFKKYRIELPDFSVREGMLDANGQARIGGIDPGTCKVSFPDFHPDDWSQA